MWCGAYRLQWTPVFTRVSEASRNSRNHKHGLWAVRGRGWIHEPSSIIHLWRRFSYLKTISRFQQTIECGEFVCEYAGEVLSRRDAVKRSRTRALEDPNYMMTIKEVGTGTQCGVSSGDDWICWTSCVFIKVLPSGMTLCTYIDPTTRGNAARFINHRWYVDKSRAMSQIADWLIDWLIDLAIIQRWRQSNEHFGTRCRASA